MNRKSAASLWTLADPAGPTKLRDLGSFAKSTIWSIAFSPDGRTVAMGGDGTAGLWDVSQAQPRQTGTFSQPGQMMSIAFSRDGRSIAATNRVHVKLGGNGGKDWMFPVYRHTATVWDLANQAAPIQVASVPLSTPDMARLATAMFSPDERTLLTSAANSGGWGGTATVWDATKLAELRADPTVQACSIAGRGLTEDEWTRLIPDVPYQPTCPNSEVASTGRRPTVRPPANAK